MNKEQQELLDEVYGKYADSHWTPPTNPKGKLLSDQLSSLVPMEHSKESFINKIKANTGFSQKWGLKIKERELSLEERAKWLEDNKGYDLLVGNLDHDHIREVVEEEAPIKLITITYNNKTIESYE
jgi:hypothetical protein